MFLEWMALRAEILKDSAKNADTFHIRWKMIVRPGSTGWLQGKSFKKNRRDAGKTARRIPYIILYKNKKCGIFYCKRNPFLIFLQLCERSKEGNPEVTAMARSQIMSEKLKYEIAKELGVYDKVTKEGGWGNVSSKDCGNIVTKAIQIAERSVNK